jgi:hypothetical protein
MFEAWSCARADKVKEGASFGRTQKPRDFAGLLPQLDVVAVNEFSSLRFGILVVLADEIDGVQYVGAGS